MPLNIDAEWSRPIVLVLSRASGIYECPDLNQFPETPAVYIFGRQHGKSIEPLYIGRASKLRQRMKQQFDSVKLMSRIKGAGTGGRFLIYCTPRLRQRQTAAQTIRVMEDALIAHALGVGWELLQKQGTVRPSHTVKFSGNRTSETIAGRFIRLRAERKNA